MPTVLNTSLIGFSIVYVILLSFILLFALSGYLLNGFAILGFCKKLGIKNGGLGFVPIANVYKMGQIADKSCAVNGEKKHYARIILILQIVSLILFIPYMVLLMILMFNGVSLVGGYGVDYAFNDSFAIIIVLCTVLLTFIYSAISITLSVFVYISHYKTYKLFAPNSAVLYIVLSIVLPFLTGLSFLCYLFLFIASRNEPSYPIVQNQGFTYEGEIQ